MHRGKKKRNIIIFSLVGLLLCMVVGYAAFSTNLKIDGTSKITSNWDIKITNVTEGKATGDAENAKAPDWDSLSASMEANLYSKGDAMEYDVTIENNGSLDAKLDDIVTNVQNANSDAVIITFTGYKKGEVLESKTSKVVHVKIEYNPNYNGDETSSEVEIDFDFTQDNKDPDQPATYMLTFDYQTNGGTRADSEGEYLTAGSSVDLSNKAYKNGWTFVGWNTDKNAKNGMTSYEMEAAPTTLYAIFSKNLTVTYEKGNNIQSIGKNNDACTIYNNETSCQVTLPTITVNTGYTIDGWYHGNDKVGNANDKYNLSENVTLTSKATQNTYQVTYNYSENGGTSATKTSDSVGYGSNIDLTPTATKSGWTFVGWNTDKDATSGLSSLKMGTNNVTLYAIFRKEAKTITITFNKNGATSQTPNGGSANTNNTLTQSCTIAAVYNNDTQATTCNITSPTINASSNTPTVVGYNTSASATTSSWNQKTEKAVSANATYYAITRKDAKTVTVTFNKNGATSQTPNGGSANTNNTLTQSCTIAASYNGAAQATSCNITSPTINASSNTPTVIGYNTSASATTSSWSQNTSKSVSSNATYYAITRKDAKTITITFEQNGAAAIGATSKNCTIAATYNGAEQDTTCNITSPTITASSNTPTVIGWSTAANTHSNQWSANTEKAVSANDTYYAQTTKAAKTNTITFNKNGATSLSSEKESCTIAATYNGTAQATNCSITSPTITAASGFTALGFNTTAGATSSSWNQSTAKSISGNATYYAITRSSSQYTATFNANGATSIGSNSLSCYRYNGASSCNVTAPTITRSGFTITGWGESASATTAIAKVGGTISLTANKTFYAITSKTITLTYNKGAHVSSIGASRGTCTIQNNNTNCQVTLPTITPNTGYTSVGWSTTNGATSGTAAGSKLTVSANGTYYANAVDKTAPTKPTITNSSNGNWTAGNVTVTVTSTDAGSGIDHYEWYENGAWTTRALDTENGVGTITFTSDRNATVQFRAVDKDGNISEVSTTPVKIDTKNPTVSISTTATTNSITVVANASAASGISKYEYSKDGGKSWTTGTGSTYTFTGITQGQTYDIMVRVTSGVGKTASASAEESTVSLSKPTFTESGTTSKTVTIKYPSGCGSTLTCTYQKDNGTVQTVTSSSVEVSFTDSGSLKATVSDGTNTASNTYTVKVGRTVTYNYSQNGGTSATTTSAVVEEGSAISLTPTATKSGWTFVGWNTNKDATTKLSSLTMGDSNVTLYAIFRKEAKTITITFNKNGATSQTPSGGNANTGTSLTQSCTIAAVYNNATQATSCNITSPTITAPSNTPTVVGYNTSASATSSSWNHKTSKAVSANATYYAITRKDAVTLTAKYNANGASLSSTSNQTCTLAATYNGKAQATSCTVTAPTITRSGYTILGYNTSASSTSNNSSYNTSSKALTLTSSNNNSTWYAITRKTVTITFEENGASAIGATSRTCNMYNTSTSCSVTSPSITASTNTPTIIGWSTAAGTHTNEWSVNTAKNVSANDTYYAQTSKAAKTITITFNKNGATSQTPNGGSANTGTSLTQSCTIAASYNGTAQATSCNITSPTINASSNTPTVIGYNTSASATSSSWNHKTSKAVSANATYYAITRKDAKTVTITFNKNNATSQTPSGGSANTGTTLTQSCTIAATYNGTAQATSCNVTSPTIKAPTNTPTVVGYNTSASATTSSWSQNTAKSVSSNATYYAITRKDAKTITITFNQNGASAIGATSRSCTIAATYNGAAQATSCSITSPTITGSSNTPTVIGWSTAAGTHSNQWGANSAKSVSANDTYYAQTTKAAKTITITFDKNGASAIGATSRSCTIAASYNGVAQATSCSITSPTITGSTNTPTVIGWSTAAGTHSNQWGANTAKSVSANDTYYAQTTKAAKTITITFDKNGASAIGATSKNCTIAATYNGTAQATSCSITSPTITGSTNTPTVIGWSTAANTHSNQWGANTAKSVSANDTYYAQTTKAAKTITVTFNKNGASAIGATSKNCTIAATYNGTAQATTCSITSPTITAASGFSVLGWNTSAGSTSSAWTQNSAKTFSANATYYAITRSSSQYTATFNKNGATSIGSSSLSCYRYNGASTCNITTPTITRSGFTITGWGTSASATSAAVKVSTSVALSKNITYYAVTSKTVTVSYSKGSNVSSIGATSNSCTIRNSATNCSVTLPSITAASTYVSNGWYNGSTKAGNAGASYTVSNNVTLTAQAVADTVTLSASTTATTNSITVVANASATSGISKYEFSKDGGSSWVNGGTNKTYTFTGLTQGTSYSIRVRVTAASGKTATASKTQATSSITKPTFSESGVYPKTVKITFPSGCGSTYTCSYKKDNGSTVTVKSTTANVSFDNHGSLVAYVSDGTNTVNSSYTVTIKLKAADLSYDNTNTSLPCEDAQCALDELKKMLE